MSDTLEMANYCINGYQSMADEVATLMNDAKDIGHTQLAILAFRAHENLVDIVAYFEGLRSALLEEEGAIEIPIENLDKPKLTLIKGGVK